MHTFARDLVMPETVFSAQNKKGEKSKNSVCMAYSRERKYASAYLRFLCFEEGYHETAKKRVRRNDIHRNVTA